MADFDATRMLMATAFKEMPPPRSPFPDRVPLTVMSWAQQWAEDAYRAGKEAGESEAERLRAERDALRADASRIDWLADAIEVEGAIHLHDGKHPSGFGLGLLGRTLRAAIDAARGEK